MLSIFIPKLDVVDLGRDGVSDLREISSIVGDKLRPYLFQGCQAGRGPFRVGPGQDLIRGPNRGAGRRASARGQWQAQRLAGGPLDEQPSGVFILATLRHTDHPEPVIGYDWVISLPRHSGIANLAKCRILLFLENGADARRLDIHGRVALAKVLGGLHPAPVDGTFWAGIVQQVDIHLGSGHTFGRVESWFAFLIKVTPAVAQQVTGPLPQHIQATLAARHVTSHLVGGQGLCRLIKLVEGRGDLNSLFLKDVLAIHQDLRLRPDGESVLRPVQSAGCAPCLQQVFKVIPRQVGQFRVVEVTVQRLQPPAVHILANLKVTDHQHIVGA